tara:strand:- start:283 stop:672 length:390 start_codon:yes stop_codon:yes gene_type:complete
LALAELVAQAAPTTARLAAQVRLALFVRPLAAAAANMAAILAGLPSMTAALAVQALVATSTLTDKLAAMQTVRLERTLSTGMEEDLSWGRALRGHRTIKAPESMLPFTAVEEAAFGSRLLRAATATLES